MAQLTDLEKVRRRRANRRMARSLLALGVFALIVWLGVTLIRQAGEIDLKTAYSDIRAEAGNGEGYPAILPGGTISRFTSANDAIALLSDTNLYTYNASGKQMMSLQHGMANQMMVPAHDRVLLYDRGGTRISLYSKSALINTLSTEFMIYTADLAQNGNFAAATSSNKSLAEVVVYNKNAEGIFKWYSSRPVSCLSLADNRDAMMVGCVDVTDGGFLSRISRFQFSIDKEMGHAELPGELLLSLDYRGSTVRAITDKRAVLYSGELKELASHTFGTRKPNRFYSAPNGPLVLIFGNYAEDKQLSVTVLGEDLEQLSSFKVNYDIADVKADQGFVYLAAKNRAEVFSLDGARTASVPVSSLHFIEPVGDWLYYVTNTEINRVGIKEVTAPPDDKASKGASKPKRAESSSEQSAASAENEPEHDASASGNREISAPAEQTAPDGELREDEELQSNVIL